MSIEKLEKRVKDLEGELIRLDIVNHFNFGEILFEFGKFDRAYGHFGLVLVLEKYKSMMMDTNKDFAEDFEFIYRACREHKLECEAHLNETEKQNMDAWIADFTAKVSRKLNLQNTLK